MTASLNPYISHFDEEFDAEKSSRYRLTIQCSLDGLSFALLDTGNHRLVAVECYLSELFADNNYLFRTLEQALEAKDLNNRHFQMATCLIDNRFCTLVPEPLFNKAEPTQYLDFAFQIPEGYTVLSERLASTPCYLVSAHSKALQDKLLSKWGNASIMHSSCVFINNVMDGTASDGVYVHVHNRDFDMLIKKDGKLLFFNNFKFYTKEDFAYFMLFAMEQNGISGQDTAVCFSGLIRPASDIIDLCGRYVKDIRFVEDPHVFQVSPSLDKVPFQYYFILYQALR